MPAHSPQNPDSATEQRSADRADAGPDDGRGRPQDPAKDERLDPITGEFFEYYVTDRGHHPRSIGGFTVTSSMSHIHAGRVRHVGDIAPRPVLLVTGDQAFSRWFTEIIHEQAGESSELVVVPGPRHIDLYDRTDLIPFGKLEAFFSENLK